VDRNLFLAFALSFAVLILWSTLVGPRRAPPPTPSELQGSAEAPAPESTPSRSTLPPLTAAEAPVAPLVPSAVALPPGERIHYETPLYRAELDTRGAGIAHWELRHFDSGARAGREPIVLTTGREPLASLLVTPFDELGVGDLSRELFEVEEQNAGVFAFHLEREGIAVHKTYVFREDSYAFELRVEVENRSAKLIVPRFAVNWPAHTRPGQDFREQALGVFHDGSVVREPLSGFGRSGFFGGAPDRTVEFPREVDWAGVLTTYFVGAVLPENPTQASARFVSVTAGESGLAQVFFEPVQVPPGQSVMRVFRAYLGPLEPGSLAELPALMGAIDLGWSWVAPLTRGFGWLLSVLHSVVPNYGLAIILLTIMVRLAMVPLTNKQMRSMERMRALAPQLQELKEKYGDDRQKQSEEMMGLYRREKVNPLGGCLPMILQLPVFIGLFYALRSSIQLRQAPFFGWIDDLSAPDQLFMIPGLDLPFRVLPLVMGATMVVQQRITPMQMDPAQAKMMMTVMPIMMTFVFYQFASGLVLYWMVSNVLAITHQLWIGRNLRAGN
jgi:YidC/Oxa1 family membrane protein insertase